MRPNLKTVAARAGVSKTAVSLCLNNHPTAQNISASTRERIFRAAEECNYQPHFLARALSRGKTNSIGLVIADLRVERQANFAAEYMRLAEARGQSLLIGATMFSEESELRRLAELKARQVDGAIFQFPSLSPRTDIYRQCLRDNFPVVKLTADPHFPHVIANSGDAMADAARAMKRQGNEKVYGVIGPPPVPGDTEHQRFFENCFRDAGLDATLVQPDCGTHPHDYSDELLRRLADEPGARFVVMNVYNLVRLSQWVKGPRRIITFLDEYDPCVELDPKRLLGIIHSNFGKILAASVDLLLQWVDRPDAKPALRTEIPATFMSVEAFKKRTGYAERRLRRYELPSSKVSASPGSILFGGE